MSLRLTNSNENSNEQPGQASSGADPLTRARPPGRAAIKCF
jgi:hypothetical protein